MAEKWRLMDLQMFADDGVEDDDPAVEDETEEIEDDEAEDEEELDEFEALAEDDEEAEEGAEGAPEQPEGQQEEQQQAKIEFTPEQQQYIDQIVQERLARDRRSRGEATEHLEHVQQLEEKMGMRLPDIISKLDEQTIQDEKDRLMDEYAMTEEEAATLAKERYEARTLKQRMDQYEQHAQSAERARSYEQAKQAQIANPKMASVIKKYEAEIDQAAGNGNIASFDVALWHVLGKKYASGELSETVRNSIEQQTMANISKRGKTAPIGASQSGKGKDSALSPEERRIAKAFGMTAKEYAKYKK